MRSIRQLVTSKSKLVNRKLVTSYEVRERALAIAKGLTSTTAPNNMTGWYCKGFRLLGEQRYTAIASMAREPGVNNPPGLFARLLKEEIDKHKQYDA